MGVLEPKDKLSSKVWLRRQLAVELGSSFSLYTRTINASYVQSISYLDESWGHLVNSKGVYVICGGEGSGEIGERGLARGRWMAKSEGGNRS